MFSEIGEGRDASSTISENNFHDSSTLKLGSGYSQGSTILLNRADHCHI